MKTIVFLVSGGGGTLKYIFHSISYFKGSLKIIAVIGDRECDAVTFARNQKIENYVISYNRSGPDELNSLLIRLNPDIIVTNIHKILDKTTLHACSSLFINLHYSLLPSFKGLIGMAPVDQANLLNTRFIGVTSHFVVEEVDGGKIISQATFMPKWEQQDLKLIYDTVFQMGCIVLLLTILSKCNTKSFIESKSDFLVINDNKIIFSEYIPISQKEHSQIYKSIQ